MRQVQSQDFPNKPSAAAAPKPKMRVAFVLLPRFTLTAFAGFVDTLRLAADEGDRSRPLDCAWSVLGGPVKASCGTVVEKTEELKNPERFDYVVVVGGLLHGGQAVPRQVYIFLEAAARARVNLIGLCTGSFVLARAGLLNGYASCVSWFHRDDFTAEFPDLGVVSNQMYLIDRDRMTCAGGTSVVHLAAYLVEKHCGRAQAAKSLRILIEDQPLPSNTMQPELIVTKHARDRLVQRAMLLMEQRLSEPDSIASVSRALGVGIRKLERRFMADVGVTPREYRLRLRMMRAKWMVEHTDFRLTDIGLDCGFGNCSHFSRAFARHFNIQPSNLRHSVNSAARALEAASASR
jgi:transcriptional regulator GlxA family with amidase domain